MSKARGVSVVLSRNLREPGDASTCGDVADSHRRQDQLGWRMANRVDALGHTALDLGKIALNPAFDAVIGGGCLAGICLLRVTRAVVVRVASDPKVERPIDALAVTL